MGEGEKIVRTLFFRYFVMYACRERMRESVKYFDISS